MGVPKFFRWLSERYPAISQLIADNRIPEFDCLYLDMNGIIHNCTHKDAGEDVTFRLTEDEMFIRIFNYIEHLFGKIKPKQLFFMAIDGVAPRAKMNQQRARRFKTALEAERAREKAKAEGKELPDVPPFDSNCITPGTEFMAKLSRQLRYFVNKKVTEDSDWQRCEIVLSGHEVPGEGEHKIMEYIRNAKAQHSYSPHVRHCLYGLDADLIMLGLLSHDPHFCLLREEVKFGRNAEKSKELEHQNFYLLHLCVVREYLELEFQELKKEGFLSFPFDLERVIDDFILMGFFIGNDFLPNLPGIHINEGALAKMFGIYKRILPKSDGYLNEGGVINLKRLSLLLDGLSEDEKERFDDAVSGEKWFEAKQIEAKVRENGVEEIGQSKTPQGRLVITSPQRNLWKQQIRPYVLGRLGEPLNLGPNLKAADRKFVQDLADTFHLDWVTKEEDGHRNLIVSFPPKSGDDEDEEEGSLAANRITKKYDNAMIVDLTSEDAKKHYEELYSTKRLAWKTKYYLEKFPEWKSDEYETELTNMCENYVQGLQWVLYYYYRGIASWPWFYAYHYSPMTSDVVKGLGANLTFKKGNPFRPYEQLMGVLPDRSKSIVPRVYWDLMTNPDSSIIDFYPREFEQDLNGKKMDWEAVVKIPFIEERRLLAAMEPKNAQLTEEEKARNGFGVALKFTYSPNHTFTYPSSLPGIFHDIQACQCIENIFDLPPTEGLEYRVGLMAGAKLNLEALAGFPSLQTLPFAATLVEQAGVCVFQSESRNPSMIVTLSDTEARTKVEYNKAKLGKRCFVGYPFLQEAKIVKVSDELFDYTLAPDGSVIQTDHTNDQADSFGKEARFLEKLHLKRLGINIASVECLVTVDMLKGLMKTDEGAHVKEYGPNPSFRSVYASQTLVDGVVSEDERFIERPSIPIEEEFPVGTRAFFLGEYAYGRPLEVQSHSGNRLEIMVSAQVRKEPEFPRDIIQQASRLNPYKPSFAIARELNMHPLLLSKITSAYFINSVGGLRVNLGLNLKFDGKKQKVLGYSHKSNTGWEFSQAAIMLLVNYITTFPDFFAALGQMPQNNDISHTDIWPDPAVAGQRVKEIGAWLKAQDINKFEKVPLDAQQLDSIVVQKLAEMGGKVYEETAETKNTLLKGVPRSAILKPLDAELVLANQHFEVGDRVTYAAGVGKVPIASKGTVVGISRTAAALLLDTLWDTTFMSGNTLGERAPPFRGQTVPSFAVINLTKRQVLSGSKAAMLRSVPTAASLTTLSTSVGVTIFKDAPTPEPLDRGWRNAVRNAVRNAMNGPHHDSPASRGRNSLGPRGGYRSDGPPSLQPSSLVYRPATNSPALSGNQSGSEGGPSSRQPGRGNRGGQGPRGGNRGGPRPGTSPSPRYNPHPTQGSGAYAAVPPPSILIHDRGRGGRGGGGRGRGVPYRGGRGGGNPHSEPTPTTGTAES